MNNKIEEYVAALSYEEKFRIIEGWEVLQKTGAIGDEPIRIHARALMTQLNFSETDAHIVMWMSQIALESYRYFAWRAINQDKLDWENWEWFVKNKMSFVGQPRSAEAVESLDNLSDKITKA